MDADIELLESVEKRAVRMTSGLSGDYEGCCKAVSLMTLEQRRKRGDMIEVWKLMHGHEKIDTSQLLTRVEDHSERTTRSTDNLMLVPPNTRLEVRRNFFSSRIVAPWNQLPVAIKKASSIDSFKFNYDKQVLALF